MKIRFFKVALLLLALLIPILVACSAGGTLGTDTTDGVIEEPIVDNNPARTEIELYEDGYNTNLLVGFDEYGRSFTAVNTPREDKEVGIFYFLLHGQHGDTEIYDLTKIREEYGDDVAFHQDSPNSPSGATHWWGEPLWGYYNSGDEYVIRRNLEMLTSAGVDFLIFDATNAFTYPDSAKKVMKVISDLKEKGWDAPGVVFMTHSYSIRTMQSLYDTFYKTNTYPESWYEVDGKPMIIGYTKGKDDQAEAQSRGDTSYNPGDLSKELRDFFYVREPRWPYEPVTDTAWPFIEWSYPQPLNGDMINVTVASHPALPMSFSLTHQNWGNWGRGYNPLTKKNNSKNALKGTLFEYQWKTVFKEDPRFVMITGWNEWVANKSFYSGEYAFTDCASMEYSRDIEPMKGGYEDTYYTLMMANIRQFKYNTVEGTIAKKTIHSIDIAGSASQWDDINAVYRRIATDSNGRNSVGGASSVRYKQESVDNVLTEIKVTYDKDNLYFMIKCRRDIIVNDDKDTFMNLFIGVGSAPEVKGWEGYDFVIGRSRANGKASIEALSADYSGKTLTAQASYTIQDDVMQISIPRKALGLSISGDFYFKVADGVKEPEEIMNYYTSGIAMPMGRLSYLYQIDKIEE